MRFQHSNPRSHAHNHAHTHTQPPTQIMRVLNVHSISFLENVKKMQEIYYKTTKKVHIFPTKSVIFLET